MAFVYWIHKPGDADILTSGYVGVTVKTVEERYQGHKYSANSGSQFLIHKAMRKHDDLVVDTVLEGPEDYCYLIESKLRPTEYVGYNIACGGRAAGIACGEGTREKISAALRGKKRAKHSPETNAKRVASGKATREANKAAGKILVVTEETRAKLSAAGKGRVRTPEQRQRYSDNHGKHMLGKTGWLDPKSNKTLWSDAFRLYDLYSGFNKCGHAKLSTACGDFTRDNLETIVKKFKSGWNPNEDEAYLTWLNEYKQKEAVNAQTQPA